MSDPQKKNEQIDNEMLSQLDMLMELDVLVEQEGPDFFENMDEAEGTKEDDGEEP